MSRCGFISLVLAAAVSGPLPLHAQQRPVPVVGFLTSGSVSSLHERWVAAFFRGLSESGYVDGQNVKIEYRAADDHYERLPDLAMELVKIPVAVIVAAGGPAPAIAAKKVTNTTPIVFTTISDPVKSGLVDGLSRPGGNVTGTAGLTSELDAKRLELLFQIKPGARLFGVLVNPNRPGVDAASRDLAAAAKALGCELVFQNAATPQDIDAAFAKLADQHIDALVVSADPFFNFRRAQVIALAARYAMPAIYQWREFVEDGGLMSYGPSIADAYHQTGVYAGRIIKGESPANLPVIQPTTFELVISQKTARALGLNVPAELLARADTVIE